MTESPQQRKIIHVDLDAFYAAVEVLDNPEYAGKPLIVGGRPGSRGVVATASYEARKFGIHSAMPAITAQRLCPEAIFVPARFERYKELSDHVREIFRRHTPLIEPLSMDEAYLDVTDHRPEQTATQIAKQILRTITKETGLTASAGVAPNKMVAKIASDFNKPNGITVIQPHQVRDFMSMLPVRKIPGIGPVSERKLEKIGIKICRDVTSRDLNSLREQLGDWGIWLWQRAQGIDDRSLSQGRQRKSLSHERTYARDLDHLADKRAALQELASSVADDLKRLQLTGQTITVKSRLHDYTLKTRALTLPLPTAAKEIISQTALALLERSDACRRPVRLLGIGISRLQTKPDRDSWP